MVNSEHTLTYVEVRLSTVYAILDPFLGTVMYVGVTKQTLERRLHIHWTQRGTGKVHSVQFWLDTLKEPPPIIALKVGVSDEDRLAEEWLAIEAHKPPCNIQKWGRDRALKLRAA